MFNQDSSTKLINSLASLNHGDRIAAIIELGRESQTDANLVRLLDELQQGNQYQRLLALYSCYGSYDGNRVLTAISDPSSRIRNKAIHLITVVGRDAEVLTAFESINFKQRRVLLIHLRQRKRLALVDRCLAKLMEDNERQAFKLLAYGTAAIVNQHLTKFSEQASINEWSNLARLHPQIALHALAHQGGKSTHKDWRFVSYFNACVDILAELDPDATLALIQNLTTHPSFNDLNCQSLIYYRPLAVAQLTSQAEGRMRINLNAIAHKLPSSLLISLIDQQQHTVNQYGSWLPKLKPEERVVIYEHCHLSWRDQHNCLATYLLKLLPKAIREQEARYHLDLPILATRPTQRIPYAAFLPWDETWAVIQPYLRNPEAELRILALETIIYATRYERTRLPDLLKLISDRSNEQDPVRNVMFSGLASLPPSIWQPEHLAALDGIISDALKAADLSQATANHGERLILRILPFHGQWSARWLRELVQTRGAINFYTLESSLNNQQVQQLAPILLPVFQSWATREREWNIIQVAQSFGKRLTVFDDLVEILSKLLVSTRNLYYAGWILDVLKKYRRDRLKDLIPQLLKQDPSWFTQPVINQYLHNCRQDLLTPYLGQTAFKGKFSTGKTRFVLFFGGGYSRWTDQQQDIFARSLDDLTRDGTRDAPTVWRALAELALLPSVEPTRLTQLASIYNPQEAVRDRALRALAKLDGGQGVGVLLAALEDARARIAIYALRTCLMVMPVEQALSILQNAPWRKITVAKEIIRLLGDLDSATAYEELLTWQHRDLHRDVRIALLRALWEHLERADSWNILGQAAIDPDETLATMVGRTPGDRLSDQGQAKLISLLITLLNRPEPTLRLTILKRCTQLPVRDTEQILLSQLLKSLNSSNLDEIAAAAQAIFTTYQDANAITATIEQIIPQRQSLNIALTSLNNRLSFAARELLPIVRGIISVLARDSVTIVWQIQLAVRCFPWSELAQFLTELDQQPGLNCDALTTAVNSILACGNRTDFPQIDLFETALAESQSEQLRRVALAALIVQTQSLGWNQARLEKLQDYRQDPSLLVAAAAQFVFPPSDKLR